MIPIDRVIKNIFENRIICVDHERINGMGRIKAISISKIMNRTINRKNCSENGFREEEFRLIPHSNVACFSSHFFVNILRNRGIINMVIVIRIIISLYRISCIIIYGRLHKVIEVDKKYMLVLYRLLVRI